MGWTNTQPDIIVLPVGATSGARIVIDGTRDVILVYNTLGQLSESLAAAAGTDGLGNSYPEGYAVYSGGVLIGNWLPNGLIIGETGLGQIRAIVASTIPELLFQTTNPNVANATTMTASVIGFGASGFDEFDLEGPNDSTNTEQWFFTLRSASQDGTQRGQAILRLLQGGHVVNALLGDFAGAHLLGDTTAVQPGTGNSTTAAVAETWHTATVAAAGWTATGAAQPLRYKKTADNCVRLDGELLTTGAGPWPANTTLVALGANYAPTQGEPYVTRSDIAVAAGQATVNVLNTGGVQNGQTFTAAGQRLFFSGITYPLD